VTAGNTLAGYKINGAVDNVRPIIIIINSALLKMLRVEHFDAVLQMDGIRSQSLLWIAGRL
jgi:hypothetical protein